MKSVHKVPGEPGKEQTKLGAYESVKNGRKGREVRELEKLLKRVLPRFLGSQYHLIFSLRSLHLSKMFQIKTWEIT